MCTCWDCILKYSGLTCITTDLLRDSGTEVTNFFKKACQTVYQAQSQAAPAAAATAKAKAKGLKAK
eukprot:6428062-Karenia_brevis.AAC.1